MKLRARAGGGGSAVRRLGLAAIAFLLAVLGLSVPAQSAAAATATVTVSNAQLTGTAPVKVGDSLTFTADLSGVSGAVGDTFTITLPAELDFAGALSFPILGDYGVCSWSGKTATCTLTKTATNASGGISLWLKAVATHTGGSSINVGGTTVVPGVPGGSIQPGASGGPSTSTPAVTKPVKKPGGGVGGWNDYYATHPGYGDTPVLAEWDINLPVYTTDTKVTISDSLVSGNGYTAHSYWFGALDWSLDHWVVSNGTYNGAIAPITDVRWGGTMVGVNYAGGSVTDAVLTVSADKKSFTLTFTAKANATYHLRYYTTTDSTPVAGDLLKNNVTVAGYQTDAVITVAGGSAWLRENYAQFAIKKAVTGAAAGSVPIGTDFTVHYTAGSLSKDLTVPYDMTSVTSDWVPAGTKFTITEVNLPTVPGVVWGDYTVTGSGVTKNADGSYSVTPAAGATVQLTLTNSAGNPPTPKIEIVKKDAAGNDANTTGASVDLAGSNGAADLAFTIKNVGTEDLKNVVVSDSVTAGSATVTNLSCDFSALGGPATGTTWAAGPFKVGASFPCTAKLAGVLVGEQHTDVAKVTGVGFTSNTPVSDDDPYNAVVKPEPAISIVKKDAAGNDANTTGASVDLTGSNGMTDLVFTIKNAGTEDLNTVVVTDEVTVGSATVTGLSCDFSPLGGPATGTTWAAGPFKAGAEFTCTAKLSGVVAGEHHTDMATVSGVGVTSKTKVTDEDPYNADTVEPAIEIVKKDAAGNDANTVASGVDLTKADGKTGLVFTIRNLGTEDLTDVTVSDQVTAGAGTITGLTCDFAPLGGPATGTTWAGPFLVGKEFTCTAQLAGVTSAGHTDEARVDAVGRTSKTPVTDDDPYNATVKGKVSVGDYVWVDTNNDGRQDAGEPGIPGVTLVLTGPDGKPVTDVYGNPVGPVVTDADGLYTFENLPILKAGESYTVGIDKTASAEVLKPYLPTKAGEGDRAGDSSDWTASSEGLTTDGDRDPTLDFGFVLAPPTPEISIVKADAAGNDADDVASSVDLTVAGGKTDLVFTITNTGTEALADVVVSDQVTAGSAKVTDLSCDFSALGGPATGTSWAGPFEIGASFGCTAKLSGVVAGEQHTDVASVAASGVTSGTPVTDDNPYHARVLGKVSVGDYVWVDTNNDGRQDAGEPGIPGVTLVLTGPDGKPVTDVYGNPVAPVVTDVDGKYTFENLPVLTDGESYTVSIDKDASKDALAPYVPTKAGEGDREGDSSDWTAKSEGLTKDGDRDPTLDFGFVTAPNPPAEPKIDIVKADADGNNADDAASAVDLTKSKGKTDLAFTIANTGNEDLVDIKVSDKVTAGSGTVSGLSCDFSALGGPAAGTTWAGPFPVGASFGCTATLEGVTTDGHVDVATVDATGAASGTRVTDDDPYHADVTGKVSVGDVVWVDTDSDGRQGSGEPGIPGVTLVVTGPDGKPVTDINGNPVGPVVTDADGKYTFENLPVLSDGESYTVSIDKDASAEALKPYVPTKPGVGDRAGDSSDWSAKSEGLAKDGERDATLDFGFVPVTSPSESPTPTPTPTVTPTPTTTVTPSASPTVSPTSTASVPPTVSPAEDDDSDADADTEDALAFTGTNVEWLAGLGGALVLIGGFVALLTRRRRV